MSIKKNLERFGENLPETTGLMITIQHQVINCNSYQIYIWKDPNITNGTYRKFREKRKTIQHKTGARRAFSLGDYTHRRNQAANIGHQMWTFIRYTNTLT
jgi:hypothetical protein